MVALVGDALRGNTKCAFQALSVLQLSAALEYKVKTNASSIFH